MNDGELDNELGAILKDDGQCTFRVWAPARNKVSVHLSDGRIIKMKKDEYGYFQADADQVSSGLTYQYILDDDKEYPDPASFYQPGGVHKASQIIDHAHYKWNDHNWKGLPFGDLILYELHVGTFTKQGTFEAIIPLLDDLYDTGINALELMPVGQFPGDRDWGYDGVYPYAVQHSYGGPEGLKKLVDACHQKGIAVFLDVIYNHLGPEGNYFSQYGPYFSDKYKMPWGDALNFDGQWSDGVKDYFSSNAIYWLDKFHIDGLRLDAIHTIYDDSAVNFWEIMHEKVHALESKCARKLHLIAESDLNSPRVITPPDQGGYGFDAQWLDDFHHALYVLLDANGRERYEDYGTLQQLAKAYSDGFVLSGEWVKFRKKKFGASSKDIPSDRFVVFNQNHDQVGNRVKGERLSVLVDFERLKIAAAAILLSPYVPMLFMGEEFGEDNPFHFFVSYSEESLITGVREGRKKDFSAFHDEGEFPDPQDEKTFNASKLNWEKRKHGKYNMLLNWHKQLIALRKQYPAFKHNNKETLSVDTIAEKGLALKSDNMHCLFNLSEETILFEADLSNARLLLSSKDEQWMDSESSVKTVLSDNKVSLPPLSVTVFQYL